ncbi:hypothetical protein QU42_03205 [Bradyrhizobium sp. UASWS1016]|jgi:membrane protein implicated in regulation of membrane protease activity|uniref:Uncharacterized protein n=1 Tax=Bradyrhizobium betae TaxID=244734 RepID=A0A5P6PGU2_9BRAD|nr:MULTISPECIES: hypothetical protein [Bradyrhizobium]MCW5701264.1 hypothetical protein [Bradyrhizobium sp.]OYU86473.1 MAG: hypothetical protein CFE29_29015 [Bradyrhizobiaceae bacterium PARB1]AUD00218.1 hypothetical protein CWS35_38060 [Bradyrhizobium sp. SK17]MCS3730944.1 membrane protein implicated in regulation of membrane protease activity [Bradyrhizobium betae]OCX32554.1 hypothetical protein QU42_03205 [Bradyrhizobium sp. UASWS1016]
MRWFKTIILELYGLFVDDGSFAITIVVWLGVAWLVLPWLIPGSAWGGAILFAGLAVILTESVWRHRT